MEKIKNTIKTDFGWVNYYYEISNEYPDGVVTGAGSFIHKEYRGQGKFKEMLKELLSKVPTGTIVQIPVGNRKLIPLFKRLGFIKVKRIAYWGQIANAYEAIVTQELIDSV